MIVEPHILIPVTQIVGSFPCLRETVLKKQFAGAAGNINYALVLGNIVHEIFQRILECMNFTKAKLNELVKSAISLQLVELFYLKKTERDVEIDCHRGIKNITTWIDMVLKPEKN